MADLASETGTGASERATTSDDSGAPRPPRSGRRDALFVALGAAAVGSVVLLVVAYGEGRRSLAFVPLVLAVVVVGAGVALGVHGIRTDGTSTRVAVVVLAVSGLVALVVVPAAGYRAFVYERCTERVVADADLAGCDLAGWDLQDEDLSGVDLSDADLTGADLSGADLTDAGLARADLRDADLAGADLRGANLRGASIAYADFSDASLANADLRDVAAVNSDLSGAYLSGADLTSADLTGVVMTAADLAGSVLAEAELAEASLFEANLSGADLGAAHLAATSLELAMLTGADFTGAELETVTLDGAELVGALGLTDEALAGAFDVDILDVAQTLADKQLFLEDSTATLSALGAACNGTAVPGAGTSASNGTFYVQTGIGTSQNTASIPPALRFAELVVCVGAVQSIEVDVCPAYFFVDTGAPAPPITRYRETQSVRLVSPVNGAVVAEQAFDSPPPPPCPETAPGGQTRVDARVDRNAVTQAIPALLAAHPIL